MARLMMLVGYATGSDASDGGSYADSTFRMIHPRTLLPIRKFGVRQIIAWNRNGVTGGAISGLGSDADDTIGAFGCIELHDTFNAPTDITTCMMKIPISGKSRIDLDVPENGLVFRHGIWLRVGEEGAAGAANNGWETGSGGPGKRIDVQLVGYEYPPG